MRDTYGNGDNPNFPLDRIRRAWHSMSYATALSIGSEKLDLSPFPSHRDDLAGIIEPRIVSTGYEYPRAGTRVLPVHVTYGFTLYSPHGKPVASWEVTGTEGKHPFGNPFAAISYLRENFEHAMREAAWKFTSGFRDIPAVREWLAEQGVPKD